MGPEVPASVEEQRRRDLTNLLGSALVIFSSALVTISGLEIDRPLLYIGGPSLFVVAVFLTAKRWWAYRRRYPSPPTA